LPGSFSIHHLTSALRRLKLHVALVVRHEKYIFGTAEVGAFQQ
jgi:hypothetical protein